MVAVSFSGAKAQVTNLSSPVGIGITSTSDDLHIHDNTPIEPISPPVPDGEGRDFTNNYETSLRMTNTNTGTGTSDGFAVLQQNTSVTLRQYEKASINIFANNGSGLTIDSVGRIGIGGAPNVAYRFNVNGKTRLGNDTRIEGSVVSTGSLSMDGNGTFGGGLTVAGNTSLGNGFSCSYDGHVRAKEVRVTLTGWSDFVFDDDYRLPTLGELEEYVRQNRHLPNIPSESEAISDGVDLGEMNARLLQKIEELTLYVIDLQKQIDQLKTEKQ